MKVVVLGAGGMLGQDVVKVARNMRHQVVALEREDLDVTLQSAVERRITRERPGAVINCAGWTDVDGAEDREAEATKVNGDAAGYIASATKSVDAKALYISTDYVFDGTKRGAYAESDQTGPINAYGRSKLAGEQATANINRRSFIVRTAWLFGPGGGNFVETMLRLAADSGQVLVPHDQVGSPTYTGHLAAGLVRLIDGSAYGIHHMAGTGSCSWYEFAEEIFKQASMQCRVMGASSEMVAREVKRPANSVLASRREMGITLPPWQRGLSDYLTRRARLEQRPTEATA
jgi:dTDP-4-dehydrorhamnose reductase